MAIQSSKLNIHHNLVESLSYLASLIQRSIDSSSPRKGQILHTHVIKSGIAPNTNICIKLIILHIKCGSVYNARKLFDQMPNPTLSAYNYMISGYFRAGLYNDSLQLIKNLPFSDLRPDGFTISMALKISSVVCSSNLAKMVHAQFLKLGIFADEVLYSALIDSYVKNSNLRYARSVFGQMPDKNLVCSTALLVGYMNEQSFEDAEELFNSVDVKDVVLYNAMIEGYSKSLGTTMMSLDMYKKMQYFGFKPTVSSFVSVIGACSLMPSLEFGKQVHAQIVKLNHISFVKCGSALIDMYSKCGSVDDARVIFDHMNEKNVISWTSMIDGYGKNGMTTDALSLFEKMKSYKVRPNHTTVLSIISTCGHAGLDSTGKEIFKNMDKEFGLKPKMEHYACMVDLIGRTGNLGEAYQFIGNIPEKPNYDVWGALLGVAKLHGDVNMAKIASEKVFELSGDKRPGAYMALSNTLAGVGNWDDVNGVREMMKRRRISKDTGCSWDK